MKVPPLPASEFPEVVAPTGNGFMSLFAAAFWVATEGGALSFDPTSKQCWERGYRPVLDACASDALDIVGVDEGGLPLRILGATFDGCAVHYPGATSEVDFAKLMVGEDPWISALPSSDFEETLIVRGKEIWTKLRVLKPGIRRLWPFSLADDTASPPRTNQRFVSEDKLVQFLRSLDAELAGWGAGNWRHLKISPLARELHKRLGARACYGVQVIREILSDRYTPAKRIPRDRITAVWQRVRREKAGNRNSA
jgi:hypothetical protein